MSMLKGSIVFFLSGLMLAWGQTPLPTPDPSFSCPSWMYFQSSQEMLASMTMQLRDMVAKITQQYSSSSESLTGISNLFQLVLAKQILAEQHHENCNTPATACGTTGSTCSRNDSDILKQLVAQSAGNRQAIQNLTAIVLQSMSDGGYTPSPLLSSCEEIKEKWPDSLSDYYTIVDSKGHARHVYCQMEQVCGSSGWMRVAYLNMSEPGEECPSGFRLYNESGIRACGRQVSSAGCQSVQFPTYSMSYSEVCGRVIGYQYGSPDAFFPPHGGLNSYYVDGISLTCGSPRKHIWTFVAGLHENMRVVDGRLDCPCNNGSTQTSPSFVGNDYFCESGCPGQFEPRRFYPDPLWDGEGCGSLETACCRAPGLPWFHKVLNTSTTDYMEMRVCADQAVGDEDIPVGYYDISGP